jgi:hypothetical protein
MTFGLVVNFTTAYNPKQMFAQKRLVFQSPWLLCIGFFGNNYYRQTLKTTSTTAEKTILNQSNLKETQNTHNTRQQCS